MHHWFFWQNWSKSERTLFVAVLGILLLSTTLLGVYTYLGFDNVLHWDVLSELDEIPTVADNFSDGQLKYTINGNAYLIKERYLASAMETNPTATGLFLGFYALGLLFLLSACAAMPRYWFLGGMVVLAGVLITFHLENAFQATNQAGFLIAFVGFAGLGFYFNSFGAKVSFLKRFAAFSILCLVAFILISLFSKTEHPFLALASYGLLSAIVLTVLFVLLIAHEIVAAFVWIVSNSGIRGKSSLSPFLIISSIYLLNVLLMFLERQKYIDWNILPVSPMVLYIASMILGVWGFRNLAEETDTFQFRTRGGWLFLGLAIIATTTLGLAIATGNDPLTDALLNIIVTAHLIMGVAFFLYVVLNFIQAMQKGLPIFRILYRPQFLELSLFRLGAIVGIVALISMRNYYIYHQTTAGYYNILGDYYRTESNPEYAEAFYKEALRSDVRNHKSNYSLATLAMEVKDKENTGLFLKNALEKNPSPYAYAGLSKVLQEKDMFFDALFTLQEGVRRFPESQPLLTNLAWLYEKTKVIDSTRHYLNLARQNCKDCGLAESNLLAVNLKYGKKDSLDNRESSRNNNLGLMANEAARVERRKTLTPNLTPGKNSLLNVSEFALIYNLTTSPESKAPYSANDLKRIQQKAGNQGFYEDLEFAIASQNYYRENKLEGIRQLTILANDSTAKKYLYNQVVGMWYLQQGVFDKAVAHLSRAGDKASVDVLQRQGYQDVMVEYQQTQAETLLKNAKDKDDFDKTFASAPLNTTIIKKTLEFYNARLNKPDEGYNIVFKALQLNDASEELWKLYVLQSLKIGMENYAEDGLGRLKQLTPSTDYQAFLSTYQAQKALMEKNKDGFE